MKTFKKYFEENQLKLMLPPIPPGFIRLTHFTSPRTINFLLQGQNFKYNQLDTTTDAFSNNEEVINLISSGKTGPFERSGFGTHVVLLDMSNQEHKIHRSMRYDKQEIQNNRIVGVVDRTTMQFTPNPNYTAQQEPIQLNSKIQEIPKTNTQNTNPVPIPTPSSSQNFGPSYDTW